MRLLILFLSLTATAFISNAQEMPRDAPLTSVQFETTTIDYGNIPQGSSGLRIFKFKNVGNQTLFVYNVFTTSHCKIISKPTAGIAPGESGQIEILYDTKVKGKIVKTLTVKANVENGIIPLNLIGTVL